MDADLDAWPLAEQVPEGVARALGTARALLSQAYEVYDLALVAATWSLLVLEAGLRDRLQASDAAGLKELISQAESRRLITSDEAQVLHGTRELRNHVIHGALLSNFDSKEALTFVRAIQEALSDLYSRALPSTSDVGAG